jgi:hypothetical protein
MLTSKSQHHIIYIQRVSITHMLNDVLVWATSKQQIISGIVVRHNCYLSALKTGQKISACKILLVRSHLKYCRNLKPNQSWHGN